MAALDQAAIELANSLNQADIPIKLRCAACNALAVNAFKLPCCDQSVCENCQASLSDTCPICSHNPLDGTTCKPNKSLRLTVKAFLKSEEKKRVKDTTEPVVVALPTPILAEPVGTVQETPAASATGESRDEALGGQNADVAPVENAAAFADVMDTIEHAHENDFAQSGDNAAPNHASNMNADDAENAENPNKVVESMDAEEQEQEQEQQGGGQNGASWDGDSNQSQMQAPNGSGPDATQQGFPNMDWSSNAAFNPMAMQTDMQNGTWGAFPGMMAMPGMNMNPMNMPQNMFGGFGGMGMNDMSGMNMGMGFGGYGGGWNAQQGMSGNFGGGYYPNAGYNQHQMHQGPYGAQMQHQQFPNSMYQNRHQGQASQRGYGRGRGGYGARGGGQYRQFNGPAQNHHQTGSGQYGAFQAGTGAASQHGQTNGGTQDRRPLPVPSADPQRQPSQPRQPVDGSNADGTADDVDGHVEDVQGTEMLEQGASKSADDVPRNLSETSQLLGANGMEEDDISATDGVDSSTVDGLQLGQETYQQGFDVEMQPNVQAGSAQNYSEFNAGVANPGFYPANQGSQHFGRGQGGLDRGNLHGRGYMQGGFSSPYGQHRHTTDNVTVLKGAVEGPPIDAPKGPKAMREGLPNSGIYSRPGYAAAARPVQPTAVPDYKERSPSLVRQPSEHSQEQPQQQVSESRDSSRHRKRKHAERTPSVGSQDEEARERRRERRRRHDKYHESERRDDYEDERSSRKDRSREDSPEVDSARSYRRRDKEAHRSSRSHRDHNNGKESRRYRHRSRSPEHANGAEDVSSEAGRRKSRSHRERDRDRDREHEREKDKDRKRSHRERSSSRHDKGHDKDREHRHGTFRRSRYAEDAEPEKPAVQPPDDEIGFKIKGSKSSTSRAAPDSQPASSSFLPPTGPKNGRARDRRSSVESQHSPPAAAPPPTIDHHAQEREARNRERMLREQQRRESATISKRPRGSVDEDSAASGAFAPPTGPKADKSGGSRRRGEQTGSSKNRRVSYKYEDDGAFDEERAAKIEKEREADRWR